MRKIYQIFILVSFLITTFLSNTTLHAKEALKFENKDITPWVEVKLQYDDNVFLDSDDEKDDLIVTVTPGVSLEWPFQDNVLRFDYHLQLSEYMDNTSQAATNHYVSGELEVNWRDIGFTIYDDFERVFERPSTEDTSRVKRDDNTVGFEAKLQKERLGIQLGYEHFIRNYRSEPDYEPYDRKDRTYSLIITHQTSPKTKLLFEYDFSQIRYDESTHSDSDYHQFLVGAIGDLTPKTTATIKTGYQSRDYEQTGEPGFNTGVLYIDATHKFSDKNAVKVSFLRSAEESTYDVNNFYKVENVSTTFDHFFSDKLLGFVTALCQRNSYPQETTEGVETKKRRDKYYSLGVGLRYYLRKWLTLTVHAEHIVRDSNFEVFEYDQNLLTLAAKAVF